MQNYVNKGYSLIAIQFALVMYEMMCGYPLDTTYIASIHVLPNQYSNKLRKFVQSLFENATEFQSVKDILSNNIFSDVKIYSDWDPRNVSLTL